VESDFTSYIEDGMEVSQSKICMACGLSVYAELEDAMILRGQIPGLLKKRIAVGFLRPDHGKIKPTPSKFRPDCGYSHHTWWKPTTLADPSSLFDVCV
jgi:hypothetical protein